MKRELKHPDIECGITHSDELSPWYLPLVVVIWLMSGIALFLFAALWDLTIPVPEQSIWPIVGFLAVFVIAAFGALIRSSSR